MADILTTIITFAFVGWAAASFLESVQRRNNVAKAIEKIQQNNRVVFEQIGEVYFAYNNNTFLAQGQSYEDIVLQLNQRYPTKIWVIDRNHKASVFGEQQNI